MTDYVVRPAALTDVAHLLLLAHGAGKGLTTLPADDAALRARVEASIAAFGRATAGEPAHGTECFLLVLEHIPSGVVCGTAAAYLGVGHDRPFWNFRQSIHSHMCHELGIRVDSTVLMLANDYTGAAEVGTLYLDPAHRVAGNGALLARARYLLMALAPQRFGSRVIAELRGWLDEDGQSPFWEAVGRHFFHMSFDQADHLSGIGQTTFIADLMPKFPIYADLLPPLARAVIGKPQDASRPALSLLLKEGFRFSHSVDIFDAGPVLEAHPLDLRSVRDSREAPVRDLALDAAGMGDASAALMAVPSFTDFRVIRAPMAMEGGGIAMTAAGAAALGVSPGQTVRWIGA